MFEPGVHGRFTSVQRIVLSFLLLLPGAVLTRAAEPGESVVVVYNDSLPASKEIAFHYARKRHVPENQILSFALPTSETISREEYKTKLQEPLWNELKKRRLLSVSELKASGE